MILIAEERATWLEFASGPKVAQIKVPSLRVRRQDIESMVRYELRRVTRGTGQPIPAIEPQALKRLQAYDFPNNVRELFLGGQMNPQKGFIWFIYLSHP